MYIIKSQNFKSYKCKSVALAILLEVIGRGVKEGSLVIFLGNYYFFSIKTCCGIGLAKSGYQVNNFLISQRNHMLLVLIRSASGSNENHNICFC